MSILLISGCEMLYVIDQRLRAQSISLEKSAQGNFDFKYHFARNK